MTNKNISLGMFIGNVHQECSSGMFIGNVHRECSSEMLINKTNIVNWEHQ